MKETDKNRRRRIRGLIILLVFTAMILSISTYAWFIGMRTVNVSSFDVEIAATEDLQLSLNGYDWDTTVYINSSNFDEDSSKGTDPNKYGNVYQGHTNWWAGHSNIVGEGLENPGLIPMSSVGDIDTDVSRLILFEKASLNPTKGGYRLLASQVPNDGASEVKGYVAFDLFIRNYTGRQYNIPLNVDDEEAIYLSTDSAVTVSPDGVANTGIENSVRVAFAQIARVEGSTANMPVSPANQQKIVNMTCQGNAEITSICASRTAAIWEPNDLDHVTGAINWYTTSCRERIAAGVADSSYSHTPPTLCQPILNGSPYPTYAVKAPIVVADGVDVYDGAEYNTWEGNIYTYDVDTNPTGNQTGKLYAFPYFTDSMKEVTGVNREEIFTLAPNSVTKVRVYVWIEGQDIDNYDYASIGKMISINFGFTKQRFEETDVNYEGPDLRPVFTIDGTEYRYGEQNKLDLAPLTITSATAFDPEDDITIFDNVDGTIDIDDVLKVHIVSTVDKDVPGTYYVKYRATNSNGLSTVLTRTIIVT